MPESETLCEQQMREVRTEGFLGDSFLQGFLYNQARMHSLFSRKTIDNMCTVSTGEVLSGTLQICVQDSNTKKLFFFLLLFF